MKIYLKRPNGRKKNYAIYSRIIKPDGKTKDEVRPNPEITALNNSDLPEDIKLKNALEIKRRVEQALGLDEGVVVHNEDNERIVGKYWQKVYSRRKHLVDREGARTELHRSVRALGSLSLVSADAGEIEDAVASHGWDNTKQRRVLGKIKLLLKFLGRDIELESPPEDENLVSYITETEFLTGLAKVEPEELKTLLYVLFYTGMRLGEAFGLDETKVREHQNYIIVNRQVREDGTIALPKNKKTRRTFVRAKAFSTIKKWVSLIKTYPLSRKQTHQRFKKYFGHSVTVHDLRHCYAINLLSKGVPLAHVAQSIGNSVKVCEKYYTGHILVDEAVETMKRIVGD